MEPSPSQMETPPPFSSKESRINRYKPIWRFFLISNLALGAYMFALARKKNSSMMDSRTVKIEAEEHGKSVTEADVSLDPVTNDPVATALVHEEPPILPLIPKPTLEPIPEDQQREIFQWILEEKRKIKPKDAKEKKQNNEDKAILKQFIREESIPRF